MWLLEATIRQTIEAAQQAGDPAAAAQQLDFEARYNSSTGDGPRLLTVAGSQAQISVQGVLTNTPSYMAYYYGGGNSTYPDIAAALAAADADPTVARTHMVIDSPGGTVAGLFDTLAAIEHHSKPITVEVANMAASAAYAIATAAGPITARNRAARFGSVGIVASAYVSENEVTITSTDAPNKAPDLATAEGKAIAIAELDAMHELFAESIATGRHTTIEKVNAEFGQGGIVLADEALKRGMIDTVAASPLSLVGSAAAHTTTALSGGDKPEQMNMDLATLKASHPALHAQILAEGAEAGIKTERDRAAAHITLGEMSGDMKTTLDAVKNGDEMTQAITAVHLVAAANKGAITARQDESSEGDAAAGQGEDKQLAEKAASATILNDAAALLGVTLSAEA